MRLLAIFLVMLIPVIAHAEQPGNVQRGGVHDRPVKPDPQAKRRVQRKDLLHIVLYDAAGLCTETVQDCRVGRDGNIAMPLLKKPIRAAGRTVDQLEKAIQDAYEDEMLIQRVALRVEVVDEKPATRPTK